MFYLINIGKCPVKKVLLGVSERIGSGDYETVFNSCLRCSERQTSLGSICLKLSQMNFTTQEVFSWKNYLPLLEEIETN